MERTDVTDWMVEADESMGADPKIWITPKGTAFSTPTQEVSWLFKTPKTGQSTMVERTGATTMSPKPWCVKSPSC
ncbi:hypothetical protein [Brevibacterium sp. SMBL_HHYL_HB1]|uniref:hypothetical protein n=1 Tax=Brevibacterium sp. SMBL_HHYL_HB1 TaxID=2777556 RepID=UPI001BA6021C|nr:hypothetical protein [Brevibacterium sp. SMBL_HHYL_HB1]QUL78562.1 hypothetical protein IG171_14250 [Brevibacterium sp. SMBL_HHYL_HB1]